jgi:hypothetical protein
VFEIFFCRAFAPVNSAYASEVYMHRHNAQASSCGYLVNYLLPEDDYYDDETRKWKFAPASLFWEWYMTVLAKYVF